jgi:N-acetylmuramoyl-L-alanine amidase
MERGFVLRFSNKRLISAMLVLMFLLFFIVSGGYTYAASTILKAGSSGSQVSQLQTALKQQGYFYANVTGYYGSLTRDAVIRFQKDRGLAVDGIAGPQTFNALYGSSSTILKVGSSGSQVSQLQTALKQQGYFYANVTGYYGSLTRDAVIRFQKDRGLAVDGIAGPQTFNALYGSSSTANRDTTGNYREDIYWLARIIEAEAGAEPYLGKVAVGNVIMNRVKSPNFANTVKAVIFEDYHGIPQFSPVTDGTIYNTPSTASNQAAQEAYNGAKPVGSALYFFNPAKAEGGWIVKNRQYITTIGNHSFYN